MTGDSLARVNTTDGTASSSSLEEDADFDPNALRRIRLEDVVALGDAEGESASSSDAKLALGLALRLSFCGMGELSGVAGEDARKGARSKIDELAVVKESSSVAGVSVTGVDFTKALDGLLAMSSSSANNLSMSFILALHPKSSLPAGLDEELWASSRSEVASPVFS